MAETEATVPELTELAEGLHRTLSKLFSILRRGDPSAGAAQASDLTLAQLSILVTLLDRGPIRMTDLAAHERVRTPTTTVAIRRLEKIGLVRRDPTKPRALELLDRAAAGVQAGVQTFLQPGLPLVGQVAAGQPIVAEENIEEYIQTPSFAGGEDGEFLLRVRGDSMVDAGIIEGDLVVVRSQDHAQDGDIVVALVGEEATVKRFFKEPDHVRLQPENEAMEPIRSREVRILGRVVGVMRKVD